MKALSLSRPWDYLILHPPFKDIENRTWPTKYRGRIYVHRAKSVDIDGWQWIKSHALQLGISAHALDCIAELCHIYPFPLQTSGLVGEIDIVDCVTESDSPWFFGPDGFVLANPKAYEQAIPYRGMPGLFEVNLKEGA
jgi:hypothetical protein